MKGKKVDTQFVSSFISTCLQGGCDSQDQIVVRAKSMVQSIEEDIKRVEGQKLVRSKLLDVITMLEKPLKNDKQNDIQLLSFFKIEEPHICKYICDKVKSRTVKVDELTHKSFTSEDILFCVKQLTENHIIARLADHRLSKGEMYNDYLKFVLKD